MERALLVLGAVLGVYLAIRALAEPLVIDVTDPSTYRNDWGGPSLLGVLAVHCLPGIAAAALLVRGLARRVRSASPSSVWRHSWSEVSKPSE
jgi:hypothetical protein